MHPSATPLTGPKATAVAWPEVLTGCSGALTVGLLKEPANTNTAAMIAAALAVIRTTRFITTLLFLHRFFAMHRRSQRGQRTTIAWRVDI
jgi:hypothetical protein